MSRRPRDYVWDASRAESIGAADRSTQSFAAMPLDLANSRDDRRYVRELAGHRLGEIGDGWKWYKRLGTVRAAIERSAKIAGYAKPVAQRLAPDGTVESEIEDGRVAEAAQAFYAKSGGTRGLFERFFVLMKIPAESWLVREEDGDGYFFLSSAELDVRDLDDEGTNSEMVKWITKPTGMGFTESQFHKEISPGNLLGRVWSPARDYFDMVNSAMPSLTTEMEVLWWLTLNMRARLQSRYAMNGMFFVPSSINEVSVTGTDGKVIQQNVLAYLNRAFHKNMAEAERGEATSAAALLLRGDGKDSEFLRHIRDDSSIPEGDMKARAELRDTILGSLDVSKAGATENEEANHFTAWHNADEERRIAVQPDLEMGFWALTRLAYWDELERREVENPQQYRLWFDLTDAQVKANLSEDARQARDRGGISVKELRAMSGIKETAKMNDPDYINWVGEKVQDPYLMLFGRPGVENIDWDKVKTTKPTGPAPDSPADDPQAGPGEGQPGSPDDQDTDTPRTDRPA
jgi:hypothetical protein